MDEMTRFEAGFEERLRAFARTGVQSVDSAAVARAVAAGYPKSAVTRPAVRPLRGEFDRTRQRAVIGPWRTRSMFKPSLAVAVVVAVLIAGALLTTRRDQPVIGNPSPSLPAVAVPSATLTEEVSPTPDPQSLKLTWTKVALDEGLSRVAWLVDRFVLVDGAGAVRTSTDGASWQVLQPGDPDPGYAELLKGSIARWQNDVVGWWSPEDGRDYAGKPPVTARDVIRIVRPPAEPTETTPFKGRIDSIGIGPAGIVAHVNSHLDWDAWVASKLGDDWVSHYTGVDFKNGILRIGMVNGPGLRVVWAREGFLPGDFMYSGFLWYSPDGEQWTAIPEFPTGFGDVVGVSDGFIARGDAPEDSCSLPDGCGSRWNSSDGLTWRNLGNPEADASSSGAVLPWKGGALVTDGVGRFDFWTSQGYTELPMAAEIRAAWKQPEAGFGAGPLGLVTVLKDDQEILVTRDGVDWEIQSMPAAMAADSTLFYGTPNVAVGDRYVLVVMWSGTQEFRIPSLWLGTLEP